jgi:hypothetical protein
MQNIKIDSHEDFLKSEISEVEVVHIEKIINIKIVGFEHNINILYPKITIKI